MTQATHFFTRAMTKGRIVPIVCALLLTIHAARILNAAENTPTPSGAVELSEFIYETAPFPSCHASTVVESPAGLVAAWFGGKDEGDVSVGIWLSRHENGKWTPPVEVAIGIGDDGKRYPCWNPVLTVPKGGPLILFYKVGPSPRAWWGMRMTSTDNGKSFSKPTRMPDGILGPIRAKPIEVEPGVLLCGSSTEHDGWRAHMERVTLDGWGWSKTDALNEGREIAAIQPTILRHGDDRLQILCRTRQKRIAESWSSDNGHTWSDLKLTELPNPSAGIDGVTLKDGRQVLIYNPTERGRSPLSIAVSRDGKMWKKVFDLETEPGEYSYPAMIQSSDGKLHATYTWKRKRIKHAVLNPSSF